MAKSILVLINKPPYGWEDAFAGLRLGRAMVASGAVESTGTVLVGEGVLNAVKSQSPDAIGMPSNLDAMEDLDVMETPVYCIREDLEELGLDAEQLAEWVKLLPKDELPALVSKFDVVTTF